MWKEKATWDPLSGLGEYEVLTKLMINVGTGKQ